MSHTTWTTPPMGPYQDGPPEPDDVEHMLGLAQAAMMRARQEAQGWKLLVFMLVEAAGGEIRLDDLKASNPLDLELSCEQDFFTPTRIYRVRRRGRCHEPQ